MRLAGLTPKGGNSDHTLGHGHSTRQGSPWEGGSCGEAAQTAKRSPLFADGQLARRRATSIATTATARRLLARSFPILTQLEPTPAPEQARIGPARVVACASQHRRLG